MSSWQEIFQTNFTKLPPLLEFLELSQEKREKVLSRPSFPLNVPRRLAQKMVKNSLDDPLFVQFVPLIEETRITPGFPPEPVEDTRFCKTKKWIQKYEQRALLLTTSSCAMHCRFCFRQNFPYEKKSLEFGPEIDWLKENPSIREVILSGGDPLSLSDRRLKELFYSLDSIEHVRRIRIHSRFPIGIPERIDAGFLEVMKSSSKQLFFVLHVNHPQELDEEVIEAMRKLQTLRIPILAQTVLLRHVNDNPEILLELCEKLIDAGIIPYYLHQLDPVQGAAHFEVDPNKGRALIAFLQEKLSGYGVFRFVQEIPGQKSKTILHTERDS